MKTRAPERRGSNLRRVRLIALREFRERVGQRAYVIALVFGAIVAAAAVIAPSIIGGGDDGAAADPDGIAIVVEGATAPTERVRALQDAAATVRGAPIRFVPKTDVAALRASVREGDEEIGVVVSGTADAPILRLVTREGGNGLTDRIADIADRAAQQQRIADAGLTASTREVFRPVPVTGEVVEGSGPTPTTTAVVSVLGLLLYIGGILLTTAYATGIVSDRSNHVTERLLTAARPSEHLAGKLVGIGASGLLQFFAWIAAAVVADLAAGSGAALDGVPTTLLIFFPVALILTYVLYAAAATVLVLPVRKAEDVGGAIGPAIMLQVVAFIATTAIVTPGATVSSTIEILSLVPFFSPLLMLGRLAGGDVEAWQLAIGILGPLVLAALLLKLAAPAYARYSIDAPGGKGLRRALSLLRRS